MRFSVRVEIGGLEGIADPEGQTIERALPALGFRGVAEVRVGKTVRFVLDATDEKAAEGLVSQMCERLLQNPVIERSEVTIIALDAKSAGGIDLWSGSVSAIVAIVNFPGSNCERDVYQAVSQLGGTPRIVWHSDRELGAVDAVVIPGGFAHGDYLRPGAIARFSPIMDDVVRFSESGGPVLGVCNGFQVLTEAGLLPGALMRNEGMRFICETVSCEVASSKSVCTSRLKERAVLALPINHYSGNFTCDAEVLSELEKNGQVVLRYLDNPNGSMHAIAGVANTKGNVVGLMPHPERAVNLLAQSNDGVGILASFLDAGEAFSNSTLGQDLTQRVLS